MVIHYLG